MRVVTSLQILHVLKRVESFHYEQDDDNKFDNLMKQTNSLKETNKSLLNKKKL